MVSNRLVFAVLASACVTAAGVGGYVATRQATAPTEAAASPAEPTRLDQPSSAPIPSAPVSGPAEASAAPATASTSTASGAATAAEAPRPGRATTREETEPVARSTPSTRARRSPSKPLAHANAGEGDTRGIADRATSAGVVPRVNTPAFSEPAPATATAENVVAEPTPAPEVAPAAPSAAPASSDVASRGPDLEELVVSADSVIGLHLQQGVNSDSARVEDEVEARVVRDVRVSRRVAIPAGSRALGSVTLVERGGRFKERARLGIRFHTLVLGDGTRVPISTDTIYRYGDAQGEKSAKKIGGGAVAGAILGAIIGGAKGAAVGATAGAGGGTAMVMAGDRNAAEFPSGSDVTARILAPVTVTVEQ